MVIALFGCQKELKEKIDIKQDKKELFSYEDCYFDSTNEDILLDFSNLWEDKTLQGTIGDDNKRIQIRIQEVKKNIHTPKIYFIKGKSKVKSNICNFKWLYRNRESKVF